MRHLPAPPPPALLRETRGRYERRLFIVLEVMVYNLEQGKKAMITAMITCFLPRSPASSSCSAVEENRVLAVQKEGEEEWV